MLGKGACRFVFLLHVKMILSRMKELQSSSSQLHTHQPLPHLLSSLRNNHGPYANPRFSSRSLPWNAPPAASINIQSLQFHQAT